MNYRIFVADMGNFRDSSKYEFIAEFSNQKAAASYVQYIVGKKRYAGKDIIIRSVENASIDPSEGVVDGVISAMGEGLQISEYTFI